MSKGSGGTRGTNSHTAHSSGGGGSHSAEAKYLAEAAKLDAIIDNDDLPKSAKYDAKEAKRNGLKAVIDARTKEFDSFVKSAKAKDGYHFKSDSFYDSRELELRKDGDKGPYPFSVKITMPSSEHAYRKIRVTPNDHQWREFDHLKDAISFFKKLIK